MKLSRAGLMFVVCTTTSQNAVAQATVAHERFVCTFGSSHRFVDIYRLAAGPRGGCRVDYTRDGVTKRLWAASGDHSYCVKRALGLVTALSKGSYSCRPQTVEPSASGERP